MKKIILNVVCLLCILSITIIYACKKNNPELTDATQQHGALPVDSVQHEAAYKNEPILPDYDKVAKKKGEIACKIKDKKGETVCAGTRCGTPVGDCGKKETSCKCLEKMIFQDTVSNGMPFIEFANRWNSDTGRIQLRKQGFHEVDHF